jgi:hypothetical protein
MTVNEYTAQSKSLEIRWRSVERPRRADHQQDARTSRRTNLPRRAHGANAFDNQPVEFVEHFWLAPDLHRGCTPRSNIEHAVYITRRHPTTPTGMRRAQTEPMQLRLVGRQLTTIWVPVQVQERAQLHRLPQLGRERYRHLPAAAALWMYCHHP